MYFRSINVLFHTGVCQNKILLHSITLESSHNSHGATLFFFLNIIVSGCNVLIGFGIGLKVTTEQKGSSEEPL